MTDPASPRTAESREPRHMPTICCRAHLLDAAPPPPDDERLRAAASLLAYLWEATGKDPSIRVRDLFAEDDPIVADVAKYSAFALSDEPGETHEEPR